MSSSTLGTELDSKSILALDFSADLLRYNQLSDLVVILSYGIYLPLALKALFIVTPRIRSSNPSRWLFALLVILFITTTIHFVSGVSVNFTLLAWPKTGSQQDTIPSRVKAVVNMTQPTLEAFFFSGRINIMLIDAIVVWRAYVLQAQNRPIRVLLVILFAITVLYSIPVMIISQFSEQFKISAPICNALNIFRDMLALSLNIAATVSIAWTAWRVRFFSRNINGTYKSSFVSHALQVMLEGGIILALIQTITIAYGLATTNSENDSSAVSSTSSIGFMIISEILSAASAIYPSLITILVTEERSTVVSSEVPLKTPHQALRPTKKHPPSPAISFASSTDTYSDAKKEVIV